MNTDQIKSKIRDFFTRHIRNHNFGDDVDVFSLGFVNSLFALQLVTFVESEFAVQIDDEDLEIENFKSVNSIARMVERKISSSTSS